MSFEELGLSQPILRALVDQGYALPTPIQHEAIPHLLSGRDLLGCAQTGTGKTAAFALPILHRLASEDSRGPCRLRVLVLSPTRELAAQIGAFFTAYGRHTAARSTVVFGGVGQVPQVRAVRRGIDVLVATPGRLMDLVNQGHIDLASVETLVLDEADRMMDMGFLPEVRRIIARLPARKQTIFFSATMPPAIEQLAGSILRDPVRIRIAPVQATTELIEQSVCFVAKQSKTTLLAQLLLNEGVTRAIVFTRTKHGADRVVRRLRHDGIRAEAMHGDKSQSARQQTLASFKSHRPPVLVATDLAARGIDVDGVSHIFNYDLPREAETYVHRIGRTGRAGASGVAISFCDHEERTYLTAIQRLLRRTLTVAQHDVAAEEEPSRVSAPSRREPRAEKRPQAAPHGQRRDAGGGFFGRSRREKRRRTSAALRG